LAGATVWRGVLGYGRSSYIRSAKILDLSSDLPLICEIVDDESKTTAFLAVLHDLFDQAQCGGLITHEKVQIVKYTSGTTAMPDAT
jgi:PII-like signaling protein